jgi:hypothetical protein
MSCRFSLLVGAIGGTLMGLLMSLVNLAATPDRLRFFEFIHSPLDPILGFLDGRFHFETGGDSDSYYWLLAFLGYWIFIGIIVSLTVWIVFRKKRAQMFTASMIFLAVAWLFVAGVLAWALVMIHGYGGHWGFTQDAPVVILIAALIFAPIYAARLFWKRRAAA